GHPWSGSSSRPLCLWANSTVSRIRSANGRLAVKPFSAWTITYRASGFGCTRPATVKKGTPSNTLSYLLQRVTQWTSHSTRVSAICYTHRPAASPACYTRARAGPHCSLPDDRLSWPYSFFRNPESVVGVADPHDVLKCTLTIMGAVGVRRRDMADLARIRTDV